MPQEQQIHLVIPEGTKVLAKPSGRVGVVVETPKDSARDYRVRFPEGSEECFSRGDLAILKQVETAIPGKADGSRHARLTAVDGQTHRCLQTV